MGMAIANPNTWPKGPGVWETERATRVVVELNTTRPVRARRFPESHLSHNQIKLFVCFYSFGISFCFVSEHLSLDRRPVQEGGDNLEAALNLFHCVF